MKNQFLRQLPEPGICLLFTRVGCDAENPREYPDDVAVENRTRLIKGNAQNNAYSITSHPRQGEHVVEPFGESAVMLRDDLLCSLLKISNPGVVTEALPELVNSGRTRPCQLVDGLEFAHPTFPIGDDCFHLCLLEHDFGNPDGVGIPRAAPREIAGIVGEPGDERCCQFPNLCEVSFQSSVSGSNRRPEFCRILSAKEKLLCLLKCFVAIKSVDVKPLSIYTCKLTDEQAATLKSCLETRNYSFRELPYARFAGEKEKTNVVFYDSGKLVVQGKGTQEFVEFVLEPEVLKQARLGYETVLNPDLLLPRIGVDESGKGDFFGPMCVAGVYVNESVINAWKDAEVRDSKNISSDKKMSDLAKLIRETPGCVTTVVPIGNEAYNRLYAKMRSVNTVLAWGHARVIENLMGQRHRMNPPPVRAISDQFASSKSVIEKALMSMGKGLELVQRHKAEEDVAVAAASILARDEFVKRLAALGKDFGVELPKGAGTNVDAAAKELFDKNGADSLAKISKMHFRTALRAQGLPEPPKTEWRRGG